MVDISEIELLRLRYESSGDPFYVWRAIAIAEFPSWVKDYLKKSAKSLLELDSTGRQFPTLVVSALSLKQGPHSKALKAKRDVDIYFEAKALDATGMKAEKRNKQLAENNNIGVSTIANIITDIENAIKAPKTS